MKKTITKEFKFDSAHRLYDKSLSDEENRKIFGKCFDLHGHTYKMLITVSGEETNGMVVNFTDLKKVVNELVVDKFDHKYLNDCEELIDTITTCEKQIKVIWDILLKPLRDLGVELEEIKLYETPTSYATLKR